MVQNVTLVPASHCECREWCRNIFQHHQHRRSTEFNWLKFDIMNSTRVAKRKCDTRGRQSHNCEQPIWQSMLCYDGLCWCAGMDSSIILDKVVSDDIVPTDIPYLISDTSTISFTQVMAADETLLLWLDTACSTGLWDTCHTLLVVTCLNTPAKAVGWWWQCDKMWAQDARSPWRHSATTSWHFLCRRS